MEKHAILSASSAKKWLNCTGSVALEKQFPKQESEFAKEGTTYLLYTSPSPRD